MTPIQRKPPAKRLYRSGLGGVPVVDTAPPPQRKPAKRLFIGLAGSLLSSAPAVVEEIPPRFIHAVLLGPISFGASTLLDGHDVATGPMFTMTAAAIRAAKWRAKQDTDFKRRETKRKASERAEDRAESDRIQQIEDLLKKDPTNTHNGPFVMPDAPHGKGMLITGGYDSEKIETVHAAANKEAKRVAPEGTSGTAFEKGKKLRSSKLFGVESNEADEEYDDTFVEKAFRFVKSPKQVRTMREFVFQHTRFGTDNAYHCLGCGYALTPFKQDVTELGFLHIVKAHATNLFPVLLDKLKGGGCPEDHDGMAARHGGCNLKVVCRRCKKVLYKPPKKSVRTKSVASTGTSTKAISH